MIAIKKQKQNTEKSRCEFNNKAIEQGKHFLDTLVANGQLVGAKELANAWCITLSSLSYKRITGKLIGMKYKGKWVYPIEFKMFKAEDVGVVCGAFHGEDSLGKYLALQEKQPAMANQTILDLIRVGNIFRAKDLALAWSQERGLPLVKLHGLG